MGSDFFRELHPGNFSCIFNTLELFDFDDVHQFTVTSLKLLNKSEIWMLFRMKGRDFRWVWGECNGLGIYVWTFLLSVLILGMEWLNGNCDMIICLGLPFFFFFLSFEFGGYKNMNLLIRFGGNTRLEYGEYGLWIVMERIGKFLKCANRWGMRQDRGDGIK